MLAGLYKEEVEKFIAGVVIFFLGVYEIKVLFLTKILHKETAVLCWLNNWSIFAPTIL